MTQNSTSIRISYELKDKLDDIGDNVDTYETTINKLIDSMEKQSEELYNYHKELI